MNRTRFALASDARLRKWRARFDAMPSWVFMLESIRELRYAVEHEILSRDMARIAVDVGGYAGTWAEEWN